MNKPDRNNKGNTFLMSILKRKNMVYKNYSYSTFRRLVYMKSETYG